jgi:hypothetical protein
MLGWQIKQSEETPPREPSENLVNYAKRLARHSRHEAGRLPKNEGKHLELWVGWFYRNHVLGESKRQIARSENTNYSDADRVVKYGIDQIKALLAVRFR